jgi:hypothetical protein
MELRFTHPTFLFRSIYPENCVTTPVPHARVIVKRKVKKVLWSERWRDPIWSFCTAGARIHDACGALVQFPLPLNPEKVNLKKLAHD